MSKKAKLWLILAVSLIGVGCMIFGGVMTMLGWDFSKLRTMGYETNSYTIDQEIVDIKITAETADVIIKASEDDKISVVCYEKTRASHAVSGKEGLLEIRLVDERKWYDYISINFASPKITLLLPKGQYGKLLVSTDTGNVQIPEGYSFEEIDAAHNTGNLSCAASVSGGMKVETSTGDIRLQQLSAGSLTLTASTGNITAEAVSCAEAVTLKVTTGDISLKNTVTAGTMTLQTSTGNVCLDGSDAAQLQIKTSTGDVTGSLLTPKIFLAEVDTGKVSVPKTTTGGVCEITTTTGDIRITINE